MPTIIQYPDNLLKKYKQFGYWAIFSFFLICCGQINAQEVVSPCDANPFCSDSSYVFPNTSGGVFVAPPSITDGGTVDYGVLGSEPNPVWYYMQIGVAGTMQLSLVETDVNNNIIDVDFALWGPFTDLATGCAAILAGAAPIQSSYDGAVPETLGLGLPGGSGVQDGTGTPIPPGGTTPPAAQVGEVYIAIFTNYENQPGNISFSQTAGTGSADCSIICGISAENTGPACIGDPVTLSGVNTDTTQAFSYSWTGPNGYTANSKVATFTPTAAGTFIFNLTAVSAENDTCRATTEVTINPLPNVILANANDQVLCNVDSVTLQIGTPTAGDTYQWYENDIAIPGATSAQLVVDTTGNYKVMGKSALGCTDTSEEVFVKLSFTQVDFSFSAMKGCTEDSVQFTNLSEPGEYWWNYGDGTSPDDTLMNPIHTYQDQNTYIVRLKLRNTEGCIDSVLKTVDVTHPLQAAFNTDIDSICQTNGEPIQFNDASIGAVISWNWDFNDGVTANTQNPSHIFNLAGTRQVRLVIHDAIPCYDTVYHNIYVDSLPFLSIAMDKHAICIGDEVNFTANYLHPANSLIWDFGDGTHWDQGNATTHSFEQEGIYPITVTADYPVCASVIVTDSVVVKDFPTVYLGPDSVLCLDGPSITVTDTHNASDPSVTWLWSTGATTASIDIVHPGAYSVTATRNDCSTTEDVIVNKDCYTDIPNAFTPNGDGTNDYFYPRQLLSEGVIGFSMTIFNRWGQKVFETTSPNGRGWDGKFNEKDQPMGVYIYQIKATMKNGRIEDYTGNVTLVR